MSFTKVALTTLIFFLTQSALASEQTNEEAFEIIITATQASPDCTDSSGIVLYEGEYLLKTKVSDATIVADRCNSDSSLTRIEDPQGEVYSILSMVMGLDDPYIPELKAGDCYMDLRQEEIPTFYAGQEYRIKSDSDYTDHRCNPHTRGFDLVTHE